MHNADDAAAPPDPLETALVDDCMALCAVPSVTGEEAALADECWRWGTQLGLWDKQNCHRHGNAMVFGAPDGKRPSVALVGHLDTVPPPTGAFAPPRIEGERIVALGASDMKAGIAVMRVLCRALVGVKTALNPIVVLYDREEGPFADNGLEPLLQARPELRELDLAIVMEPTANAVQLGCLGGLQATVRFVGQAAHSARPWEGVNAVHRAGPFLTHLLTRGYDEVDVDGLTFRQAMSVTLAKGGRARNVVPDHFELNVNYRFAPVQGAMEAAEAELRRVAEGAEVTIHDRSPHGPVPVGNPILAHWHGLCSLRVEPKQAWTDVARFASYGVDALNFGPGLGSQAHQAGEFVERAALVESFEMLHKLMVSPVMVG